MKSPPSRGTDAPRVHPRPRKCLSGCTLDCGFKTPESPALRGFVAERCPITGTSLYLVLLSNGLRHSKNLPVKFGFSSKTVPANIVKKLPPQRCPKPLFIASFNFSHKWPTFAFTGESGYTRLSEKDRTQRLTRRNRSLPSPGHSIVTERTAGGSGCTPMACVRFLRRRGPAGLRRPTPPAERTVPAPISPRVQLCLRRPAFPLSAFIPGA